MTVLTEETGKLMEEEALLTELRERNPHGSAADMAVSRQEIRRVLKSRSSAASRNGSGVPVFRRTLADLNESEQHAVQILNHAMEYLMNRVPMGGPDTVFADIQHSDMQAAALLARASREMFLPSTRPFITQPETISFRDRLRMMAANLGLVPPQRHSA